MRSLILVSCLVASVVAQRNTRRSNEGLEVVNPEEQSFLSRIIGEETQARVIESISSWATDKAKENPGCVERFVCESYRSAESLEGIPYVLLTLTNAAVSFMVAEQFGEAVNMQAITRAASLGRSAETCHMMKCPALDGQLRTVTDYLAGVEEILGYIVNSVSTSIG